MSDIHTNPPELSRQLTFTPEMTIQELGKVRQGVLNVEVAYDAQRRAQAQQGPNIPASLYGVSYNRPSYNTGVMADAA